MAIQHGSDVMDNRGKHRVVIVGGGFGGLTATQELAGADVDITLIDRRNHHLFQPLLYQVATTALSPSEIAWPIRQLLRNREDVTTLLGNVAGVDAAARHVALEDGTTVPYDSLILATGARHAYFGHDEWEAVAPGLKSLEDATAMRRQLLLAFERAELETDPATRQAWLNFAIVGGGPPIAVGAALACKVRRTGRVAVAVGVFVGVSVGVAVAVAVGVAVGKAFTVKVAMS